MKVALISDTHWSARSDSGVFLDHFERFYNEIFFPKLERQGVTHIIHYGDLVDRRKYINFVSLDRMRRVFFDAARDRGMTIDCLIGNHDVYYKNTNRINAQSLLLQDYENVRIYPECEEVVLDDTPILYVPWINEQNHGSTLAKIESTKASICIGHLELAGFAYVPGLVAEHGTVDANVFRNKFDLTISGHYHHKSDDGSIFYTGSPYEMTWADYGDVRGFHILDTSKRSLTFVQNPLRMFHYIVYDDVLEDYTKFDVSPYQSTYVKLIVRNKSRLNEFEAFLSRLYSIEPVDLVIMDELTVEQHDKDLSNQDFVDVDTTKKLVERYIDFAPVGSLSRDRLKTYMLDLFVEASFGSSDD